jgi:undecaprenyl-diphosphatase
MTLWQAIILGVVQGVAEFLPISSSGHLVVLERVFGIDEPGMTFGIVVHLGSLCAVVAVFRHDIVSLIKKPLQKTTGLLIVATLPAVAVGLLFKDAVEAVFSQGAYLALAFAFTGVLLFLADALSRGKKRERDITYADAVVIGCMQAVGIPPGISRSGATITGALACGLSRATAARFSFLLAIIAIAGAGVLEAVGLVGAERVFEASDVLAYAVGFVVAAVSSYFSVRLLLALIQRCRLRLFSVYLFLLAAWLLADALVLRMFF